MAAQMPLHYPCTDVGGGTVSVQGGLLVAGTDGPGGQVIPAPMVRGTIYSRHGWSGGTDYGGDRQ